VSVPAAIRSLFGWRKGVPNIADKDSAESVAIAREMFESLSIDRVSTEVGQTLGTLFELAVRAQIADGLQSLVPDRAWMVGSAKVIEFAQYEHLERIRVLLDEQDPTGTLRSELGADYIIKPDVTVGIAQDEGPPFLHAAVSCKWTIRSDRVQNIRHEGVILTRHRRGRQPHVVTVTAEPQPTRLAAIARGTGEVDCVYHAALDELYASTSAVGSRGQFDILRELVEQDRLRPLYALPEVLAYQ
jgi:hypothetical protein